MKCWVTKQNNQGIKLIRSDEGNDIYLVHSWAS